MADSSRVSLVIGGAMVALALAAGQGQRSAGSWCEVLRQDPDPAVIADEGLRKRIADTGLPWSVRDRVSQIEMLLVPPGTFQMGATDADEQASSWERPARSVEITAPFYIGRTEVTQQQWIRIMRVNPSPFQRSTIQAAASIAREAEVKKLLELGYTRQEAEAKVAQVEVDIASTAQWPVEVNSWTDLQAFLTKSGLSLPTEAQWEYACRAGTTSARYGELDAIAWHGGNSGGRTNQVATRQANGLGLCDMIGNSWEWCADRFDSASDDAHTARGGNWLGLPKVCTAYSRACAPSGKLFYGFRVIRNP